MPLSIPNASPLFTYTPVISHAFVSGVSNRRDYQGYTGVDPGTFPATGAMWPTPIMSGNNFGTRIEFISIRATGTTVAGVLRLWIDNSKGLPSYPYSGVRLWNEIAITAVTPSTTAVAYSTEIVRSDGRPVLILPSGVFLGGTVDTFASGVNVICHGGDF